MGTINERRRVNMPNLNAGLEGGAAVADLQENGGAIGGTNDGDMPDLSSVGGTYSQAEVTAIRDGLRETGAKLNALLAQLRAAGVLPE